MASGFAGFDAQPASISRPASDTPKHHALAAKCGLLRPLVMMMEGTCMINFSR